MRHAGHAHHVATRSRPARSFRALLVLAALLLVAGAGRLWAAEEAAERRLKQAVTYLASDELEGRGVGTAGLDKAADYIAAEMAKLGLKTDLYDGTAFQRFTLTTDSKMGPAAQNRLALVGPPEKAGDPPRRIELKLDADFNPLAIGGSGTVDLPLVFVGYGITAADAQYDDYQGVDVAGKAVLMIRKEPEQANPHSLFNGNAPSRHAFFMTKISNAYEHGAAAVVIVNDHYDLTRKATDQRKAWQAAVDELVETGGSLKQVDAPTAEQLAEYRTNIEGLSARVQAHAKALKGGFDALPGFLGAGPESSHPHLPVFFCSRAALDQAVRAALKTDLSTLEREIDKGPTPKSGSLAGWRIAGETNIVREQAEVKNVIAVLEGEGPWADETIVVGAHYDHLGFGGPGSLAPGTRAVHNGADDNASGVAVMIEVARNLASRDEPLARRIVFIAFTGEERGLLGSARYVRQPRYPLDKTIAMFNMDMVGRMSEDKLIVHGTGTAELLDGLVDRTNEAYGFKITKRASGFGPSDHSSFYSKNVPVLHLFTGSHDDYHRPSDDVEKVNVAGMRRVSGMLTDMVVALAASEQRPVYQETARPQSRGGTRPYFGSIPDFSQAEPGYALQGVAKGSPAERSGIKAGDIVVKFGDSKIGSLSDFDNALRKFKAGDKVKVVVRRGDKELTLTVTLDPPR